MHETMYQVLLPLRAADLPAPEILDRVREIFSEDDVPSLAAFYRCVKSALDEGWLEVTGTDSSGGGRPNRIYGLTPFGRRAVEKEARRLQSLAALGLGEVTAE